MSVMEILNLPGFREYILCVALLAINLCAISLWVSLNRVGRSVYSNPEDEALFPATLRALGLIKKPKEKTDERQREPRSGPVGSVDKVERVRRAHANAVENILPFMTVGFLYCLCGLPHAMIHFYAFTASRYLHTFFYVLLGVQPWRTIVHFTAMASLLSMSGRLVQFALAQA